MLSNVIGYLNFKYRKKNPQNTGIQIYIECSKNEADDSTDYSYSIKFSNLKDVELESYLVKTKSLFRERFHHDLSYKLLPLKCKPGKV